jgi:hypothetical protein
MVGSAFLIAKQCRSYCVLFTAGSLKEGAEFHTRKRESIGMKAIAAVLIVVGIGIVIWGSFGFTTREKVVDVGPLHATRDKEHNVPYGPVAGAVLALGGVVLLVKSKG